MKKVLFMMGITLMALAVTSCSHEDINDIQRSKVEDTEVIKALEHVNAELLASAPLGTRGWTTKEKLQVVGADVSGAVGGGRAGAWAGAKIGTTLGNPITGGVFGAAIGAIIGGAYNSWLHSPYIMVIDEAKREKDFKRISYSCRLLLNDDLSVNENLFGSVSPSLKRKMKLLGNKLKSTDNKLNVSQELIDQSKLDENSLIVGEMHNVMLSTLDGTAEIRSDIEMEDESELKRELFNSKELMEGCRNIKSNSDNLTSDEMLNKVMELFNQVLQEYPSKVDDVAFIIGKYIEVIENSTELTEDQKRHIKYGLSTALYSSIYWEQEFQNK